MPDNILMPKLGLTMSEGTIAGWLVSEGEAYEKGHPLFEVVTDKITFTVEAQAAGKIVNILIREGETVPVGAVVATAEVADAGGADEEPGDNARALRGAGLETAHVPGEETKASDSIHVSMQRPHDQGRGAGEEAVVRASPAAKKLARERNVDLSKISGTGPGGRIVEGDVQAFLDKVLGAAADVIARMTGAAEVGPRGTTVPYTAIGRTAAERTAASFRAAPHFYLSMSVDATALVSLRAKLLEELGDEEDARPSINDILVKVVARALAEHPHVNSSPADDGILVYEGISIGVAVATDQGLVVPVVHDANKKTLGEVARETKALARRAREGALRPEDVAGGTFTISNLGMFGVDEFFAVINPPQAAILGVGAVRERPVVKGGAVVAGLEMRLTLSADHRVLDGASAARFLGRIKEIVESLDPDVGV